MGLFDDLFSSITNQQATPQQTIIPTNQLLGQGYATAQGLAPQVAALNAAYQPIITGNQLASENQVFGPAANLVQRGAYDAVLSDLNRGFNIPPELQDLITTNTLQQLGSSGVGTSDAGKIFGARSLYDDANRWRSANLDRALGVTSRLPSSSMQPGTIGIPDPMGIAGMIDQEQAQRDNYANLVEDTRRKNFSSLINTGGRILGTVAGSYFGGPIGGQIGGQVGGSLLGTTGVAGMQQQQQSQNASPFNSILTGIQNFFKGGQTQTQMRQAASDAGGIPMNSYGN